MSTVFHIILFVIGTAVFCSAHCRGLFNWASLLPGFPAAAGLAAAYLWIREDMWLTTVNMGDKSEIAVRVSRQADCLVVMALLLLVAIAQFLLLEKLDGKYMFVGTLFVGLPISHCIARLLKGFLQKWHNK